MIKIASSTSFLAINARQIWRSDWRETVNADVTFI
jgi:hypothetical protein